MIKTARRSNPVRSFDRRWEKLRTLGKPGGDYTRRPANSTLIRVAFPEASVGGGDLWFGDTDDATGDAAAGVADWLRFQVVLFLMHDHATADDRFLAAHRHHV